jgi:hypothetical protein
MNYLLLVCKGFIIGVVCDHASQLAGFCRIILRPGNKLRVSGHKKIRQVQFLRELFSNGFDKLMNGVVAEGIGNTSGLL